MSHAFTMRAVGASGLGLAGTGGAVAQHRALDAPTAGIQRLATHVIVPALHSVPVAGALPNGGGSVSSGDCLE